MTLEEACKFCTNFWYNRIFERPYNSNGDDWEGGGILFALASLNKINAMDKMSDEIKFKFLEDFPKFLEDKFNNDKSYHPSVDYHPDRQFYEFCTSHKIDVDSLPWKSFTRIVSMGNNNYKVDYKDGYGNFKQAINYTDNP